MRRAQIIAVALLMTAGCAGVSATHVGQTMGTIAGAAIAPGIGAPIGALIGLLSGMVVQGQIDRGVEHREQRTLSDQLASATQSHSSGPHDSSPPTGQQTRVWVDEMLENGRVVAAHFDVRNL